MKGVRVLPKRFIERVRDLLWATPGYRGLRMLPITVRGRRFDARHGVRTCGLVAFAELDMTGVNTEQSQDYEAIDPKLFRRALGSLDIRHEEFVFVDFGSGMGRALLLASEFPFRAVVGVEFAPELHAIAEENIRRYKSPARRCAAVKSVCVDAVNYAIPEGPVVLFFYNPFKGELLARVLGNIFRSLEESPREVRLIHVYPRLRRLVEGSGMLTKIGSGKVTSVAYNVYRGRKKSDTRAGHDAGAWGRAVAGAEGPGIVRQGAVNG